MAQLKSTIVQGSLRVTDTTYTNELNLATATVSRLLGTDANKNVVSMDMTFTSPTAASTSYATAFIDTISQGADGQITATKANIPIASASTAGIMQVGTGLGVTDGVINVSYGTTANTALQGNATLFTLNGTNVTVASAASFYAPTTAGTSNQLIIAAENGTPIWKSTADGAAYATSANGALTFGTLPVAQGGTGAKSFTANRLIMSGNTTTAAFTTRAIEDRTTINALTAAATWANSTNIPTVNLLAYWDGRYQTTSNASHLAYCNQGAFGDMATKNSSDYVQRAGDTMLGALTVNGLNGTEDIDYGDALPIEGTEGQLFFQYSEPFYEIPVGGMAGQALIKFSDDNRDVTWGDVACIMTPVNNTKFYITGSTKAIRNTDAAVFNTNVYVSTDNVLMGAAWNDYAEYRKDNKWEKKRQEPGRCIRELGNGMLALTTKRLQRGCEIISDTFGFAIGENHSQGYNTPVAVSGRVLAYPYEDLQKLKKHIGCAVCSGPNGTVSLMTPWEERNYPSCVIGTISEIPTYEEWGEGRVKVNGRIWIRLR